MTVAELIQKLSTLPQNLPVLLEDDGLYFAEIAPEVKPVVLAYEGAWQDGDGSPAVVI